MEQKKNIKTLKIILGIIGIILCVVFTIYLFPVMKNLSTIEGQIAFKQKVQNMGIIGFLMLFSLQVAQIFLFIIPGEPIEILAGMCYGALWGTIFIMVSQFIISLAVFLLVKKFGRKFVYEFYSKEKIDKIRKSKVFRNSKKIEVSIILLFFIPGTPKDLLVYISGLLPINPVRFVFLTTIARFPSVVTSTLAGSNLAVGDWKMSIILYAIIMIIVGIIIFIFNRFDKNKITKDAIDMMK